MEKLNTLTDEAAKPESNISESQLGEFQASEEIRKLTNDVEILNAFRDQIEQLDSG